MKSISIDIETFSSVELVKTGVYRYASAPDFEILLFGYSVDKDPVQVVDIARGEEVPQEIIKALIDDAFIKYSFNCSFERICISVWLCRNYPQFFNRYSINGDQCGNYLDPTACASSYLLDTEGQTLYLRFVKSKWHFPNCGTGE